MKKGARVSVGSANVPRDERAAPGSRQGSRVQLTGPVRLAREKRESTLKARQGLEELTRCVQMRAKDARELFIKADKGLKGFVTVDEFLERINKGMQSSLTGDQVRTLLAAVPGPGGLEKFDYLRFAKIVNTFSASPLPQDEPPKGIPLTVLQAPSEILLGSSEREESGNVVARAFGARKRKADSYQQALQRVRDKLYLRKVSAEPGIRRTDNDRDYVIEKWVRSSFPAKQTVLEYDELLEKIGRLDAGLDPSDVSTLLSVVDKNNRGFLTVPNLLLALLRDESASEKQHDPLAALDAFVEHASRELKAMEQLRESYKATNPRHRAQRGLGLLEPIVPRVRPNLRPPELPEPYTPAVDGEGKDEELGKERVAHHRAELRNRIYTTPASELAQVFNTRTQLDQANRRPNTSFSERPKLITRRCSTPAHVDSRPRVGYGSGGIVNPSGMYMPDETRLLSTAACAYQLPAAANGGVLEFSANLEANRRLERQNIITTRIRNHTDRIANELKVRELSSMMEQLASTRASATLQRQYVANVLEKEGKPTPDRQI